MLILGQKSYFLGPTIFKFLQPNWYYFTRVLHNERTGNAFLAQVSISWVENDFSLVICNDMLSLTPITVRLYYKICLESPCVKRLSSKAWTERNYDDHKSVKFFLSVHALLDKRETNGLSKHIM